MWKILKNATKRHHTLSVRVGFSPNKNNTPCHVDVDLRPFSRYFMHHFLWHQLIFELYFILNFSGVS